MTQPRRGPLFAVTVATFAVGMGVMFLFDSTVSRIVGVATLVVFMLCGIFLMLDPELLARDEDDSDAGADRPFAG